MLIYLIAWTARGDKHTKELAHNHEVLATERESEGQAKRSKAARWNARFSFNDDVFKLADEDFWGRMYHWGSEGTVGNRGKLGKAGKLGKTGNLRF